MVIRAFITHKKAEVFADCQDRFGVNNGTKSIAVSDGMGSTWQQKIWAQLLVDTFTESRDWLPNADSIKPLCSTWREKVKNFIQQLKDTNVPENIIYRNERNLAGGCSAGATFVGIRFNGKEWSGSVLGDSCLIEWDGNEATFYSSQDIDTFDSYPDYFDSDVSKEGKGTPKPMNGILSGSKYLLLVSDPFSDFLLEHKKQNNEGKYISQLLDVSSHEEFETLVAKWREEEGMHNDDTTLVVVENDGTDEFSIAALDDLDTLIEKDKLKKEKKQEINIDEQIVSQKEQVKEENETPTDSNCAPTPVETNLIINELTNELERYWISLEKKSFKNWWSLIKKAIKEVLSRYIIYKK